MFRNLGLISSIVVVTLCLPPASANADERQERLKQAEESVKIGKNFDTTGFDFDITEGPFEPNKESLAQQYQCPDWFRDAKFGIYTHWGLCTIPGYNGHYARFMYMQHEPLAYQDDLTTKRRPPLSGYKPGAESVYEFHARTYGHPSEFGYKDFVTDWQVDKFNPDELATLFKSVGAKYFGMMAVHHDNFDNYDSDHHPWNSVDMGPKKDLVGMWKQACDKHGLRFAITSHLAGCERFFQGETDTTGPRAGEPYDTVDPEFSSFYGVRTPDRLAFVNPGFAQNWYLRTKDLIDKYDPDLLYLDGGLPYGDYGVNLATHFYNSNVKNRGKLDGVFTIKHWSSSVPGFTLDKERHNSPNALPEPWQTDTTINPGWFLLHARYKASSRATHRESAAMAEAGMDAKLVVDGDQDVLQLKAGQVVDNLIDIVSKNGNMMLNVGLRADGSLPEAFRDELVQIGEWMKLNGEGIYGTRPYKVYGEGSFKYPTDGHKFNDTDYVFGEDDFRFTKKGGTLYAFLLTFPAEDKKILIKSLKADTIGPQPVAAVKVLGTDEQLAFEQTAEGLLVTLPEASPHEFACGLKIEGLQLSDD